MRRLILLGFRRRFVHPLWILILRSLPISVLILFLWCFCQFFFGVDIRLWAERMLTLESNLSKLDGQGTIGTKEFG